MITQNVSNKKDHSLEMAVLENLLEQYERS